MEMTKACRVCDQTKPRSDFPKYGSECKACESARKKAWYCANHGRECAKKAAHYRANHETINAARRKGKPIPFTAEERRLRQLASNKRWAASHPEVSNAIKRRWEARNKTASAAAKTAWKRENPAKSLAYTKRRQALKKATTVILMAPEQRIARVWLYGPRCTYCGKMCRADVPRNHPDKATEDHQIPLSRGGPDCGANLRIACHAYNLSKGALTVKEFRAKCEARRHDRNDRPIESHLCSPVDVSAARESVFQR